MGKYSIEIKRSAVKVLKKLPKNDLKKILEIIRQLANNPRPAGCRKLSSEEVYRIRYRFYRILYVIENNTLIIYVMKVGHRNEIYR